MADKSISAVVGEVPWDERVTAYDEAHFVLYVWLLDAALAQQSEDDMCRALFKTDPCDRTRMIVRSHLKRAKWMTEHGYRQLLNG